MFQRVFVSWLFLLSVLASPAFTQDREGAQSGPATLPSKATSPVPGGKIEGPFVWTSTIYPGTTRQYWIYVPQQYQPQHAACLLVVQDGLGLATEWNLPSVMDQLIAEKSMPITIGLFIDHGKVLPPNTAEAKLGQPRFNRSFEYDSLGDRYANFLMQEMIPELKLRYAISDDPNDRMIAGASSGGICAFNVAWERPDQFRRVLSTIGSYVDLRGGGELPSLIRKWEAKPLRVYLEDGKRDLDIYAGDWWVSNLGMLSALQYAGYDVQHSWGDGGHDHKHAREVLPDALRWLWRDHPQPIQVGPLTRGYINPILAGEDWQLVSQGHQFTEGPAIGHDGSVYFVDPPKNKIFRIDPDNQVHEFVSDSGNASGLMMGPDEKLYACQSGRKQIVYYDRKGNEHVLVKDAPCNDLAVVPHGLYYTDPGSKKVWFVAWTGERQVADEGIELANGLIVSGDQTVLHVADSKGLFTFAFTLHPDGKLSNKQPFGHLQPSYGKGDCWADGMSMDTDGNLYVATDIGVQILDPLGRVNCILRKPQPGPLANVALAGEGRNYLYATCGDKVFRRKLNAKGTASWQAPIQPPTPGL